jgi:hypothetical protein
VLSVPRSPRSVGAGKVGAVARSDPRVWSDPISISLSCTSAAAGAATRFKVLNDPFAGLMFVEGQHSRDRLEALKAAGLIAGVAAEKRPSRRFA